MYIYINIYVKYIAGEAMYTCMASLTVGRHESVTNRPFKSRSHLGVHKFLLRVPMPHLLADPECTSSCVCGEPTCLWLRLAHLELYVESVVFKNRCGEQLS